jgi:hypothetical protein
MKKQFAYLFSSLVVPSALLMVRPAAAVPPLVFPESVGGNSSSILVSTGDEIGSSFEANQSYCCTMYPDSTSSLAGFSETLKDGNDNDVAGFLRGDVAPAVAVDPTTDTNAQDNRVCVITSEAGSYKASIATASGGGVSVTARCEKTSLSGGFNTNGTPFNFLECQNLSSTERKVHIFAFDYAGNILVNGNSAGNQFTISAGVRRDFDIHSLVGPNVFGEIRVVQDGPAGALDCRLSRYESTLEFKGTVPLK